ncbi:MAG: DUF4912 domain-containing protein [Sulfurihydrogenibium sp.]
MNEIIKLSLEEDNFSSHIIHTKDEILREDRNNNYIIPERFNVNKLILLAVNPSKFFVYWFLKDELKQNLEGKSLKLKLFVENKDVLEIPISNTDGDMYIFYHAPFKEVFCSLGYLENNEFIEILKSNRCIAPSDVITYEKEEKWYNKKKQEYISKESILYHESDNLNYLTENLPTSPVRK